MLRIPCQACSMGLFLRAVVLLLAFSVNFGGQQMVCFKVEGPCPNFPEWAGTLDDSPFAYSHLGVAENEKKCTARAKEWHEWCGCTPQQSVTVVHMPSGAWARFPPFEDQVSDDRARGYVRIWEQAQRFRESDNAYNKGGEHFKALEAFETAAKAQSQQLVTAEDGVEPDPSAGPFAVAAKLLYSQRYRNISSALAAASRAVQQGDPNAIALVALLGEDFSEQRGIAGDSATLRMLRECAWRLNSPVCHVALGYRYLAGLGVEASCAMSAVHYRLAAAWTMEFNRLDGGTFPLHDVRLSQFTEVRKEERRREEMEMKEEKARRGDAEAAAAVGNERFFRDREIDKAGQLFKEAAAKGDVFGLNNLGSMVLNGIGGFEKNYTLAVECFQRSADLVNPWGMYNLAICYFYGYGVSANHSRAVAWLQSAARWDNPAAHLMLGMRYRDGQSLPVDYEKAFFHFDKAATLGDVDALVFLAGMVLDPKYNPDPSCSVGRRALKVAAERGPWAQLVREAYEAYTGGDRLGSFVRYRLMAEMGYRTAQANVGWMYDEGLPGVTEKSPVTAAHLYRNGADQGDVPCTRRLGDLYLEGALSGGEPDYGRALALYSAFPDDAESVHNVAYMHEHGLGTAANASRALDLYKKAAALGRKPPPPPNRRNPAASLPSSEGAVASEVAVLSLTVKESFRAVAESLHSFFGGASHEL